MGVREEGRGDVDDARVQSILDDPCDVRRNLRISVTYWRLAQEFSELVSGEDAAWVQFATWTSEDVGKAIRGEHSRTQPGLRIYRRLRRDYDELAAKASAAFALGNANVFREIGASFVGFHAALRAKDPQVLATFLAGLDPKDWPIDEDDSVTLVDAFRAYADAAAADDPGERARSVALGNLALAVIEQGRVQPQIDVAFTALAERLPFRRSWDWLVARLVTEFGLRVTMGDVEIRPGKGLPSGLRVPQELAALVVDDPRFKAYETLLPPTPPSSRLWTNLDDRLTFIAALMPLLQRSPRLLGTSPFCDEIAMIERGDEVPPRYRPRSRR